MAEVAHGKGVPVIADNTVATPFLLKPISYGADVVIHSLTKFIGGHGTTIGGIIIDGGTFPWSEHADRFRIMTEPEPAFHGVRYATDFASAPYVTRCRTIGLRNTGASLSPFSAFLHLQGLETLAVRLPRHEANVRTVSAYLEQDPRVAWVSFLGMPSNPYYELGRRYLGGHVPSIMTFGVHGGRDAGIAVFNNVKLFKRLLNMGDAKSLITHPASTTHRQLTPHDLEVGRDHARHGPVVGRARASRRPHRGSRSGAVGGRVAGRLTRARQAVHAAMRAGGASLSISATQAPRSSNARIRLFGDGM